jgi:hypothetical protein
MATSAAPTTQATASLPEARFLLHRRIQVIAQTIENGFANVTAKLDQIIESQPQPDGDRVAIFFALSVVEGRIIAKDPFRWGEALMGKYPAVAAIARLSGSVEAAAQELLQSTVWLTVDDQASEPTEDEAEQIVRVARALSAPPVIEDEHADDTKPDRAASARRHPRRSSASAKK